MPFNISTVELLVLALVAVLVFGRQLPEVARKAGRGITEFKRGMTQQMREIEHDVVEPTIDEPSPPDDWERPPDGEECTGLDA